MIAFDDPRDAAACAIAIQQSLAAYRRTHPQSMIEVRIGLHIGLMAEHSGHLFGIAVNTAARIMGEADGGQIMVSSAVKEVLAGYVSHERFGDSRDVILKGLPEQLRLFELGWSEDDKLDCQCPHCNPRDLPAEMPSIAARNPEIAYREKAGSGDGIGCESEEHLLRIGSAGEIAGNWSFTYRIFRPRRSFGGWRSFNAGIVPGSLKVELLSQPEQRGPCSLSYALEDHRLFGRRVRSGMFRWKLEFQTELQPEDEVSFRMSCETGP